MIELTPAALPALQHEVAIREPERPPPPPELSPIHTYTTDFSREVGETRASAAAILAAEADARRAAPLPRPLPAPRSRRSMYVAIALIVLGGGTLAFAYARYLVNTGPVALAPVPASPIFADEREAITGEGSALMQAFKQAVGRPLPEGTVRLVYNPSATTTDSSIFNALALSAPAVLLRNIDAGRSMAGVVSAAGLQTPFFILSVASYGETFAGMLAWESGAGGTLPLTRALSALYPAYPALALAEASSTASTTAPQAAPDLSPVVVPPAPREGFADEVVGNHDARVYRDEAGRSIVLYGYWDQRTLVIARDETAFAAILDRLASARSR